MSVSDCVCSCDWPARCGVGGRCCPYLGQHPPLHLDSVQLRLLLAVPACSSTEDGSGHDSKTEFVVVHSKCDAVTSLYALIRCLMERWTLSGLLLNSNVTQSGST